MKQYRSIQLFSDTPGYVILDELHYFKSFGLKYTMSRQKTIYNILSKHLKPTVLNVENESNHHNVPQGSESHFKVIVVSKEFDTLARINRHRRVNALLSQEFEKGLHALTLHFYTETEWQNKNQQAPVSPDCRGGKKRHG